MEVFGEGDCGCGVEGNWGLERDGRFTLQDD